MDYLQILERPQLHKPVWIGAFAGFTDAQEGATRAIRYMVSQLRATKFASIDPEEFYDFTSVRPVAHNNAQGQRVIRWPSNEFYYWADPAGMRDLIFFVGSEPSLKWRTYLETLMRVMAPYETEMAITLGSLLAAAPHTRDAPVTVNANREELKARLPSLQMMNSTYQGPVGITSVFVDGCSQKGLGHVSLWGHASHYVERLPNYKVSHSLVQEINRFLGTNVSLEYLVEQGKAFEIEATKAVAASVELSTYVKQLEKHFDGEFGQSQEQPSSPAASELPRVFAEELENLLKRKEADDDSSKN